MLEDIDLTAIQDENVRQLVLRLLNLIESLAADLREARAICAGYLNATLL